MNRKLPVFLPVAALLLAGCARYSEVSIKRGTVSLAVTAEQRQLAIAQEKLANNPLEQLGRYLDAAEAARIRLAGNPKDVLRRSDYNFAVARIMDILYSDKLAPWYKTIAVPSATGAPWKLSLTSPFKQKQFQPSLFQYRPSDRYTFRGKGVGKRVLKEGLGAPLIVAGRDLDYVKLDRFAQGRNIYYGLTALVNFRGRNANIKLHDPLAQEQVVFDGRIYSLAGDYQGPLALALEELNPERREIMGLFKPQEFEGRARLARLQPYDPKKIPVILVHGLGNSPATWAPLVEFLRGDPVIRQHYQFWFFSYPSGLPYPLAAAYLRNQLAEIRKLNPGMRDPVVIGHSMGGMISRLLITDSGNSLWNFYFNKPMEQIPFSEKSRRILGSMLLFKPAPHIGRVIFVSASLRGSYRAVDFFGRLGAAIIGSPVADNQVYAEAIQYVRPEVLTHSRHRLPNSIDILDPDSLFLERINAIPVKAGVPYNSLMGDRGRGGFLDKTRPQSSDGFVPYWSSHIEGAESERVIPSGHWSHLHPLGMAEIKRILISHLK